MNGEFRGRPSASATVAGGARPGSPWPVPGGLRRGPPAFFRPFARALASSGEPCPVQAGFAALGGFVLEFGPASRRRSALISSGVAEACPAVGEVLAFASARAALRVRFPAGFPHLPCGLRPGRSALYRPAVRFPGTVPGPCRWNRPELNSGWWNCILVCRGSPACPGALRFVSVASGAFRVGARLAEGVRLALRESRALLLPDPNWSVPARPPGCWPWPSPLTSFLEGGGLRFKS